jgi:hypothetical protein
MVIQSYRWRLAEAGYPFREPPACEITITRLRALLGEKDRNSGRTVTHVSAQAQK